MQDSSQRQDVLANLGVASEWIEELLRYNANQFDHSLLGPTLTVPLPDEPFVSVWTEYANEARRNNALEVLKKYLVQLNFPIQEGISSTPEYRAATLKGQTPDERTSGGGLQLVQPETFQVVIHESPGGRIPLLIPHHRQDFVSLVQALTSKNEPAPVPESMGAATISGYNNWDRIERLERQWKSKHGPDPLGLGWSTEFSRIIERKELYKDRFMILSDGAYSNVPARAMNLGEDEWRRISFVIRREHECTHYFTERVFSSMQNNLIDEIIADYVGIVAATGTYRADWFLRFVGLEEYPRYRKGGRLENYPGDPPLSAGAFEALQMLVKRSAQTLERFHEKNREDLGDAHGRTVMIVTLTAMTLEDLASEGAMELLGECYERFKGICAYPG